MSWIRAIISLRAVHVVAVLGWCTVLLAGVLVGACGNDSVSAATDSASTSATGADTGTGTPTSTMTEGSESAEPRWVLRDRDGIRVKAFVEPRCGYTPESQDRCLPLDFASPNSFPCVRVVDHSSRYMNLAYDLATGQILPCNYDPTNPDVDITKIWPEQAGVFFMNDKCQGQPYDAAIGAGGGAFLYPRGLRFAEGDMWYVASDDCDETLTTQFWETTNVMDACVGPIQGIRMCPYQRVPDWVRELLPNPPYTLHVEYG